MHNSKVLLAVAFSALSFSAVATGAAEPASATATAGAVRVVAPAAVSTAPYPSLSSCSSAVRSETYSKGLLTVATDDPAYEPWFANNTPSNGQGYESAVAYDVASLLGFGRSKVKWVTEAFDSSYAPGPKAFDFDINEISVTPDRAKVVTFSISYYDTTQSIVALKSNPIVAKHSPAQLKTYLFGDQIGTTGLAYIFDYIHPSRSPRVYNTLDEAVAALQTKHARRPVHGLFRSQKRCASRAVPEHGGALRVVVPQGQPARVLRRFGAYRYGARRPIGRIVKAVPQHLQLRNDT
jgi:ABC-type amino acid transport substrate-binding protein